MATFNNLRVRQAVEEDADGLSGVLAPILRDCGSARRSDAPHIVGHYINHPDRVSCAVGVDTAGRVLGFQSLKVAQADNAYDLPQGWGIIGTYVAADAAGHGLGRMLFEVTLQHAQTYGLRDIDATIGAKNAAGQAYYKAVGFEVYRNLPGAVGTRYRV